MEAIQTMKTIWTIKGTHCRACKELIEEVCLESKGVNSGVLDFKSGKLILEHEASLDLKKLKSEIEKIGTYKVVI